MAKTQLRRRFMCKENVSFAFITVLVVGIVYMTMTNSRKLLYGERARDLEPEKCNMFSGKWVYDNESYPLYKEQHCFFQFDGVACEKAGRKDINYQYWRWQPHQCDLPRFDPLAMLERLRNKRLVFVGDSISRNQWASLLCLLESSVPPPLRSVQSNGSVATFTIKEYNASIEHYWSPFLVESSSDHPLFHHFSTEHVVRVQEIEKHAMYWTDADILVFNSYIWWKKPKIKVLQRSGGGPDGIEKEDEMLRGYEMALRTWLNWLDIHINRTRTKLYFLSMSPTHDRGEKWGKRTGGNCYNEKEPILKEAGYQGSETDFQMMQKVEAAIEELRKRGLEIQFLNITRLSEYRKDGHTSIYRKQWKPVTRQQLTDPSSYADCVNWCIPGVPDVWNELLFAYLFYF